MQHKIRIGQNKQASQLATKTQLEDNEPKIKHELELQRRHRCSCAQGSSKTTKLEVITYAAVPILYCVLPNNACQ